MVEEFDPAARWQRIREIFDAALDADPANRTTLLAAQCGDDHELRAEVMDLLGAEARLEIEDLATVAAGRPQFLESTFESLAPLFETVEDVEEAPDLPFQWGSLEVLEAIGAGSFGRVYRAHDSALRRDVALKLRPVDPSGRIEGGEDHLEEARRLARVRHPNVLVVYGAEVHDGWAGIWTDLVSGESLDLLLRQTGPFAREALLRVGVDLCRALAAVHAASLVHGDVKPANAMRDADGRILLMDFGAGRSALGPSDDEWEGSSSGHARQGTPVAMAPELFDGALPTVSSDLYALGVLLYRLASGQFPFRGSGPRELRAALSAQDRIPLDELRPDLPTGFARVVHRLLSLDPTLRPSTAAELQWLIAASLGAEDPEYHETEQESTHLPRFATRFVGRAAEVRQLRATLAEPGLVTVVGPGGCGKTRLAVRIAAELDQSLPGGAVWVDLASLEERGDVSAAAMRAAGLRDEGGRTAMESLADWIGPRPVLLVLDNAEHVRDSAARCAGALLSTCPKLHLLVTTRQRLAVQGERTFRLTPMAVPPERGEPTGLEILESDAVRLFLERAQRGGDDVRLTTATAPDVARIVRRVEGIPLAIELAAARVASIGLAAVAAKLDEGFRLLAARSHRGSKRHETLVNSIKWSHDLLEPDEARLLARLSVFAGGCSLEAAEIVCADTRSTGVAAIGTTDVVDLLSSLVERSLVSVETLASTEPVASSESDDIGKTRYRLLEMVRAFAALRLEESGEAEAMRNRHVEWIEQESSTRAAGIFGPEVQMQLTWFAREHGNIRTALQRLQGIVRAGTATPDRLMNACFSIRPYWAHGGHLREGREMFEVALSLLPAESRLRARALTNLSALQRSLGEMDPALESVIGALTSARATNDLEGVAVSASLLGLYHTERRDPDRARAHFEEAIAVREAAARDGKPMDPAGTCATFCNLGELEASIGDLDAAAGWYERALEYARQYQIEVLLGVCASNLAVTLLDLGRLEKVRDLAVESLRSARRTSSRATFYVCLRPMVLVEIADRHFPEARALVLEGLSNLGRDPVMPAWVRMMEITSDFVAARGQANEATEIMGAIYAARERAGVPVGSGLQRNDRRLDRLREALGTEAFDLAWTQGRARSEADTVTLALRAV